MTGLARRSLLTRIRRRSSIVVGGLLLLLMIVAAAGADLFAVNDPFAMIAPPMMWPGRDDAFPLGTDSLGRDIASGILYGARVSLLVGLASSAAAVLFGTLVGAFAGYYRGAIDDVLMRFTEVFQTIPPFMLAIVVIAILQPTVATIVLSLSLVSWPTVARLVRGEFLVLREREFVQSCRVIGMSDLRIIFCQILPNALPTVIVTATILAATAILMEAGLSFLGLGDPNAISWGGMIGAGKGQLRDAWYIVVLPGVALLFTALGLNLLGEGLNDALNPRLRERRQ